MKKPNRQFILTLQDKSCNKLHEVTMDTAPHVIHWDRQAGSLGSASTECFVRLGIQDVRAFYEPATEIWI